MGGAAEFGMATPSSHGTPEPGDGQECPSYGQPPRTIGTLLRSTRTEMLWTAPANRCYVPAEPTTAAETTAVCRRCAPAVRTNGAAINGWRLSCPNCERPLLSDATVREIEQLSDGDRYALASALGEPLLAQLSELAHDLRVSTMGEMVAGLAHELNQPLFAISNYARTCQNLLRNQPGAPADLESIADRLVNQAIRAADIVRRLRRFVSRREPRRTRLDVNQLVREVEQLMLFHAKRFSIRMEVEFADSLPPVLGDSLLIEQVLVNLVRNAFEAINENKTADARVTLRTAVADDDFIEITVSDSGPGFGTAPLEHIFDAFYTTKPSGMGLGLVISRSIVQAHGGALAASQNPAGGAVFCITLPVLREEFSK